MQALYVRLDDEVYERLRRAAFETKQTMTALVTAALLKTLPEVETSVTP